jgi:hypothetical protein
MTSVIGGIIRERQRNQPNGFAGLDANGDLLGTLVNRSMLYSELIDGVIPEVGEIVYCTDTRDIHIGDGLTVGGLFLYSPPISIAAPQLAIDDATTKTLASYSVKAGCAYRLRGKLGITDNETFNGINNLRVVYQRGDLLGTLPAVAFPSSMPVWHIGSNNVVHLEGVSTGIHKTYFNPPATPIFSPLQAFYLDLPVYNSIDATLVMEVLRVAAGTNPSTVIGFLSLQRVY